MSTDHLIYLCGPITGCSYAGATDWRDYVNQRLAPGIKGLSPMRGKQYLRAEQAIGDCYQASLMSSQRAITARDRFDTLRADLLISNLLDASRVSIGSMIEFGWADAKRIPIIVVMGEKNLHDHSMVREIASWIVPTLDEATYIANAMLTVE